MLYDNIFIFSCRRNSWIIMTWEKHIIFSSEKDQEVMLAALGFSSLDELYTAVVPQEDQFDGVMAGFGNALSHEDTMRFLDGYSSRNKVFSGPNMFAGAGHYQRIIPDEVQELAVKEGWVTPYTPYQPEVAQGILVSLFEYQKLWAELSGMAVVNAGVYHGPNSLVEAVLMSSRLTDKRKILVSDEVHPDALANLRTYFRPKDMEIVIVPTVNGKTTPESIDVLIDDRTSSVVIQTPNFSGLIDGVDGQSEVIHSKGAHYIAYGGGDQISLALLTPPGEHGADIYAAEGQHIGLPLGYGGPHVGVLGISEELNARKDYRQLPGRIVGKVIDNNDIASYMLVLQAREQHIRRAKATSNACTTQTWMSVRNVIYSALMGPDGLAEAARQSYHLAHNLAEEVSQISGYELVHPQTMDGSDSYFFNEFSVRTPVPARTVVRYFTDRLGMLPGVSLSTAFNGAEDVLLVATTEANNSLEHLDKFVGGLKDAAA
jgi:glycine dehydrogenase subunit 1